MKMKHVLPIIAIVAIATVCGAALAQAPWDVDGNGKVDMMDVGIVCTAFGSVPGHPRWDPRADVNGNNKIEMMDLGIVCVHLYEEV